jgi:hypothetical protein
MHSAEYQRGYDAGYKRALLDALSRPRDELRDCARKRLGGPDSPFKPRGVPGSIYNDG